MLFIFKINLTKLFNFLIKISHFYFSSIFFPHFFKNNTLILNEPFDFSIQNVAYLSSEIDLNEVVTLDIKEILTSAQLEFK